MNEQNQKNFLYLMQGEAEQIKKYFHLQSETADSMFLTFDQEIENAIYFPNSSWTAGRNRLVREAKALDKKYLYYILLDDDVSFTLGSFQLMEENLLNYRPALGLPWLKSIYTKVPGTNFIEDLEVQKVMKWDEPFNAYHVSVFHDNVLVPYDETLDHLTWWIACDISQYLIYTLYHEYTLQFNNCAISNDLHRDYPNKFYPEDFNIMQYVQESLNIPVQPFAFRVGDPGSRFREAKDHIKKYSPKQDYSLERDEKLKIFKQHSKLYKQSCIGI